MLNKEKTPIISLNIVMLIEKQVSNLVYLELKQQ
jgi:hypothetical protein